jgi:hypothetical protein
MLCRQCEVEQSVFENALSRSVKENGLVPRAFIASGDAFRASLCILWKTGVVLTEVTEEHGKRPVEWVTAQHARAFKGFMRDTKLYLKGEILSLLDEPNVRALHMPSWRKGTAFETTLPFILQNRRGMLVLGALVGQVVLVALISRPSDWDAWYSTSESRQKPHPEMQAMLKKVLENDMRAAFQAHVSKPT